MPYQRLTHPTRDENHTWPRTRTMSSRVWAIEVGRERAGDDASHHVAHFALAPRRMSVGRRERRDHRLRQPRFELHAPGRSSQHVDHTVGQRVALRWAARHLPAEVRSPLHERLRQQVVLRGEVAVDGAERDACSLRDVAHLHCVVAAVGSEGQRGVDDAPAPGRLALCQSCHRLGHRVEPTLAPAGARALAPPRCSVGSRRCRRRSRTAPR